MEYVKAVLTFVINDVKKSLLFAHEQSFLPILLDWLHRLCFTILLG